MSLFAHARVERVAQPVAQKVEREHDQRDTDGRRQQDPGLVVDGCLAIQQHRSPTGDEDIFRVGRRPQAQPQVAQNCFRGDRTRNLNEPCQRNDMQNL